MVLQPKSDPDAGEHRLDDRDGWHLGEVAEAVADDAAADVVLAPDRTARILRIAAVVAAFVAVGAVIVQSGILGHISDQDQLRSTVEGAGAWGPLLFVVLMVLLVPLNVPGLVFVIPATTLFGTAGGVALSIIGGFLASAIGIVAARRLGRSAFEDKMPPRIRTLEARLSERGFWAVVLLRTFTFLMQPVDWLCGVSSMPMRTALGATFVGLIPPTLVIASSPAEACSTFFSDSPAVPPLYAAMSEL